MMISTESDVRTLFQAQSEAIRTKDLERLMSFYSPDVVYFDVVTPLQFVGAPALRNRFREWFDSFDGPLGLEARDLRISTTGDTAIVHWLSRVTGTLKNGRAAGSWARATSCWQQSNRRWLVTHEHISLPVDMKSGMAATNLQP